MKKYNFDNLVDRRKTNSVKWRMVSEDSIPLWVADMDFSTADEVVDAILKRAQFGTFGYSLVPDEYYEAEVNWWTKRHSTKIEKTWIEEITGVIPALSSAVHALVKEGENVIVQTPVYQYFNSSVINNGANVVRNELIKGINGYEIDFNNFEELASDEKTTMFILCNPHNPVGRLWTKEELTRLGEICLRNNVTVVSDEIHRDLVLEGEYIPFLSISDDFAMNSVTCTAPSKTFNLAGLKVANMIIPDLEKKKRINRSINIKEVGEPGVFGIEGLISAYTYGEDWLNQVLEYIKSNRDFAVKFLEDNLSKIEITKLEATYLLWIDVSSYIDDSTDLQNKLLEKAKIRVNTGANYSDLTDKFIRINLATSKKILEEGLSRLVEYLLKQ